MAILTLSEWFRLGEPEETQTLPAPHKPRRTEPLLMGDILVSHGGEPEFVRRWRQETNGDSDR